MASIFDRPEDEDLADAYKYAQLNPAERNALEQRLHHLGAVRGVENVGRAALGIEPSPQASRAQAGAELRALAQKVRPGTAEFYDAAIPILQKYNLPAEAAQMEQARHTLESGKGELDPVLKMQRAYDLLKKRFDAGDTSVQPAMATLLQNIKDARPAKQTAGGADPEFIKLLNAYEAAIAAGQGDRAELIKKAMDAWLKAKESSGQDVAWARLALAQLVEGRKKEKDEAAEKTAKQAIVNALQGGVRALDEEINAATRLLAHPGLPGILGPRIGALPDAAVAAMSEGNAGAMALYLTIQGQTFIRALQDLKATSKTGASGLGQLTEIEGNKIQQAKAAINRQQGVDQFKRTITAYLEGLRNGRAVAAKELSGAGSETPAAPAVVTDVPVKVDPRAAVPTKRTFKSTPVK